MAKEESSAQREKGEMISCGRTWRENGKVYREASTECDIKHIKECMEGIASAFEIYARIIEVYAKGIHPPPEGYSNLGDKREISS